MPYRDEPLVTVATFSTVMEASLARGALEAIGITALVPSELPGSMSTVRGAPLAAELRVFESDRRRAAVELRRLQIRVVEKSGDPDA